jgi:phosphatidylglycerol:prolipoprotein diacylglycerol transferase
MDRVAFSIFGKDIYWYGIIIACALIVGVVLGIREAKRRGYRSEMILDFMLIAIPLCIVCARLYYVAFEWPMYAQDPIKIIAIWEGGLAIYGAVIGGLIAAVIFFSWRRVPVGEVMDIAAPSLVIAQAIGRWGNFVNQEAHGVKILDPNWQWFPAGVNIDGLWYQATFFYESAWNLIVFIVLMLLRKRVKVRGGIFALYVVLYGFGRFWIESLRTDSLYWGGIRVSQALSLVLIIGGILFLVIMKRKNKEYLPYNGIYSVDWTKEQIEDYRANAKMYRAEEKVKRAELKVEETRKAQRLLSGLKHCWTKVTRRQKKPKRPKKRRKKPNRRQT